MPRTSRSTRHFEHELHVPADAEAIWDVLTDLGAWGEWNTVVPRSPDQSLAIGQRFPLMLRVAGRRLPASAWLVRVEPGRALVWRGGVPGLFAAVHGFEIRPEDDGARVRHFETFRGVLVRPILALLGDEHARIYRRVNERLADRVARP